MTLEDAIAKIGTLTEKVANQESELTTLRKVKTDLEADVKTARDKVKAAETERDEVKAKLPSDDSVVMKKADFEAIDAKAKTVDDVTQKLAAREASDVVREYVSTYAADKNAQAILTHTPQGAKWESYDSKNKEGKAIKALRLVKNVDGKEEKTGFDDWLEATSKEKFVDFALAAPAKSIVTQSSGAQRGGAALTQEDRVANLRKTGNYAA